MPCRCSGVKFDKCKCKLLGYPLKANDSNVVLVANNESFCCFRKKAMKKSIILKLTENVYEKCAGYNLRYCQFRGFLKSENCFTNTLTDLFVLMCFLVANFVVLLAILAKIICHMYFFFTETSQRIKKFVAPKSGDSDNVIPPTIQQHDFTPRFSYKFY